MSSKVLFHFYKIELNIDKNLFSHKEEDQIEFLINELSKTSKPSNVYSLNGYQAFCKNITNNIYCFEKHRTNDIPTIGKITEDKERKIPLEEDETILEKNFFSINKLNKNIAYIIYQEKLEGFRATTLIGYFQKLLNIKNGISITQILQKDTYERLLKFGYIKGIDISFANPSDKLLKEWGIKLDERLLYAKDKDMNISIKIALNKKVSLAKKFLSHIYERLSRNTENISKAIIKGSENIDSNITELNLLNDVLESRFDIRNKDKIQLETDIIKALKNLKELYNDEIEELLIGSHA